MGTGKGTMKLSPTQADALQKALESASRCRSFASKAQALGLPVLAEFLREAVHIIEVGVDHQHRAFRENAMQQPEQKILDRIAIEKQTNALADAIARRGLP
jgi:archaellum biogenesis ATPase FlaH